MKTKIITIIICLMSIGHLFAQNICCPYITSITIIPANPTINDNIKIVTNTTTPNLGQEISYYFYQQTDTFNLRGCFYNGPLTQPQTYLDTTNIGTLSAGTYFVHYIGKLSISSTSCSVVDSNSMTISFIVTISNSIENINFNYFSIYPNPATSQITIQTQDFKNKESNIIIQNILGEQVLRTKILNSKTVDISTLQKGIYILQLLENNRIIATQKLIKQ